MAAADLGPDDSEDNVLDLCAAEEDVASLPEVCRLLVCGASETCKGPSLPCALCHSHSVFAARTLLADCVAT